MVNWRELASIAAEVTRARGVVAPVTFAKLAVGNAVYRLGPHDFLMYDLDRRPLSTWRNYLAEKPDTDELLNSLHPRAARLFTKDKVLTCERCLDYGVAIAPILAVIGRDPDRPGARRFAGLDTAQAIVAAECDWPDRVFVKPVGGTYGRGAMALTRDDAGGGWRDDDGAAFTADALAATLLAYRDPLGVLVQPRLANDPALAPIGGDLGLSATRIVTALTTTGPEVVLAVQKVFGRRALADNFQGGRSGHLLSVLDVARGRIVASYGRRAGARHVITSFDRHPATGHPLEGFALPHWPAVLEQALAAARAFPELPLLGHDLAITADGPVFLETNTKWKASLPQLAVGGLRPILADLIPRLASPPAAREQALRAIALPH